MTSLIIGSHIVVAVATCASRVNVKPSGCYPARKTLIGGLSVDYDTGQRYRGISPLLSRLPAASDHQS